ncbi:hypothetical protein RJ41_03090 [Alteromonas marina]|uniref:Phosphate ABC transporter substrate-binding protein n=1 Tax=Alteromonas marina TaxID=203795 RepID=A0A0B3YPX2_9ALTE|nr:hypothetical protein [Alteromonas marina]KHT56772.1 hypothetical protein RJ41_03090 [Alteromonas marina]
MSLFKHFPLIIGLALFMYSAASAAQSQERIVVVTNLNNDVQVLDKKGLIDLFMGKYSAFPNGKEATPIDVELDAELKSQFYKSLVGLPLARVNAYWSRLKFSGRVKPPAVEQTLDDIKLRLEEDESALAYVYESTVTNSMKVVYRFD